MTGDSVLSLSLLGGWLVTLQKKFIKFPLLIRQLMRRRRRRKVVYFRVFITFILVGLFPNPNDIIIMMMSDLSYRPITFIPSCLDPLFLLLWLATYSIKATMLCIVFVPRTFLIPPSNNWADRKYTKVGLPRQCLSWPPKERDSGCVFVSAET